MSDRKYIVDGVEFSAEAVRDGYWEVYHDDDCGEALDYGYCHKCGFRPDLQSLGARRTRKEAPGGNS